MGDKRFWMWLCVALLCSVLTTSMLTVYYYGENLRYQQLYQDTLGDLKAVSIDVTMIINYGNGTKEWHNNTRVPIGFSALNATLTVAKVDYQVDPVMGAFITAINDVETAGEFWWALWHWNSTSSKWVLPLGTSADKFILHNQYVIQWHYTSGWPPPPPS